MDRTGLQIFVEILAESNEFGRRKRVDGTKRWELAVFKFDLEIVQTMIGKSICACLGEDIGKVVVVTGDTRQIYMLGVGEISRSEMERIGRDVISS